MIYDDFLESSLYYTYTSQDPELFNFGIKRKSYPNLRGIDIDSEYEKIQHKESRLSKSERDYVIWVYNKKHENI